MKWYEITIKTEAQASEAVSEMLITLGANGVSIDDPDEIRKNIKNLASMDYIDKAYIDSIQNSYLIKAYFPNDTNIQQLKQEIQKKSEEINKIFDLPVELLKCSEIDDEDWANSWKKYYKPFNISKRIVIKPTWEEYKTESGEIIIEMDPGMAFGTGTHETTKMCAQMLDENIKEGNKVLDVGCGTGILSIIASKLGAESVLSVDIDSVATEITKENCSINNVDNLEVITGVLSDVKEYKYDVIVANIIADIIIGISQDISRYLKPNGVFISSGIIKERKEEVLQTYLNLGFECVKVEELGEWVAIIFKCPDFL